MIALYKAETVSHPDMAFFFDCFIKAVPTGHKNYRIESGVAELMIESEFRDLAALLEAGPKHKAGES